MMRSWFDSMDAQLAAEARRAGLFQHPTMTGTSRQLVVRAALQNVLPPGLHIGTGRIIGADAEPSKQVDIVVFDGRFPVLRLGEEALYPIEGVIAAIEVKSDLNEPELRAALLNAASVMRIAPSFIKEDADAWMATQESRGVSRRQAIEALRWRLMPCTYVFAFDGLRSKDSQAQALRNCLTADLFATPSRPLIPSVIAGGHAVSVATGDELLCQTDELQCRDVVNEKQIAITFETQTQFGIIASHLLWHLDQRVQGLEPPGGIRRATQLYLPFMDYIQECIREREFAVTLWHERAVGSAQRWN